MRITATPQRRNTGFTLIELLVVISIIALLISLLLPALSSARKTAYKAQCASNQRQFGYSLHQYATDNQDWIPREGRPHVLLGSNPPKYRYHYPWPRLFMEYLVQTVPLRDNGQPRDVENNQDWNWQFYNKHRAILRVFQDPAHPNPNHVIHYINNGLLLNRDGRMVRDGRHPTARIDEFKTPAFSMYLTAFTNDQDNSIYNEMVSYWSANDEWYDVFMPVHVDGPEENSNNWGGNVARINSTRHESGSNALFVDGHVDLRQRDTLKDIDSWDDKTWNVSQ